MGITIRIRKNHLVFLTADIPQNPVDNTSQVFFPQFSRLLDRLIDGRGFGDPIHEKYLIDSQTKDI